MNKPFSIETNSKGDLAYITITEPMTLKEVQLLAMTLESLINDMQDAEAEFKFKHKD